jgi:signal transduction histidine kinase
MKPRPMPLCPLKLALAARKIQRRCYGLTAWSNRKRTPAWLATIIAILVTSVFFVPFAVGQAATSTNASVINNVAALIRAAQPSPEASHSIQLEGAVWYADPQQQTLVLSDASGAAPIVGAWDGPLPQPGQRVRISGTTSIETGVAIQLGHRPPLIDNTGLRSVSEKSRSIYLEAGRHPIALDYFIINGLDNRAALEVTYEGPQISRQRIPDAALGLPEAASAGRGLHCKYYEGFWEAMPDFRTMTPVKTGRTKNFDFSLARQIDQYGLQFEGQINITRAGKYTFYVRSRDGSRLWVGRPSLRWEPLGTNNFPAPRPVSIGQLLDQDNRFWAEVEGEVSFITEKPDGGVSLELCDGAGCLHVEIADRSLKTHELANRSIRVRGYCESALDSYGRKIAGILLVPSRKEVEWLATGSSTTGPARGTNDSPQPLPTIQMVRRMKAEEAKAGHPLKVRGVVTCVQADHDAFAMQDASGGLYVINSPETHSSLPRLREFVEVEGITIPGAAQARKITRLGWGLMPEPVRPSWDQLMNGSLDTRYVEIRGTLDTFSHRKNGWTRVNFRTRDGTLRMDLLRTGVKPGTLEEYQGAVVRLRGCLFGSWDIASGRVKAAHIRMSDVEVFVDEPAGLDLFSLPIQSVTSLTRFDPEADVFRRAKVAGQIVFVNGPDHFLMDGAEGLRFTVSDTLRFEVGDQVEVVGFPELASGRLSLRGAVARKTGEAPLPPPRRLTADELMAVTHDATRICVEATLAGVKNLTNNVLLELQTGPWRLIARINTQVATTPVFRPGSTLELTGIYSLGWAFTSLGGDFAPIELLVVSPTDIRVLATPPWWTSRRLTYVAGGLGFMAAIMFLWVTLLRRKVEERTTEVRALNQDLLDRARALEMANKELESFSYSVSHDLRAPLRSIDGFSRAILEDYADKLDAEGTENLTIIRSATQRMGQLIDDMLLLAKVARAEIRRAPFDLSALAKVVAQELQTTDPARRAEFIITPGLMAEGDAALTRIALENLLGNAWKFTSKQPSSRIEFGQAASNGTTAFFVRDNGVGFDMTYVNKLFGAFQRLHSATEFPGTGIGLASVQRIIQRQGGRVWAESQPGQGATFYFTLATPDHHEK